MMTSTFIMKLARQTPTTLTYEASGPKRLLAPVQELHIKRAKNENPDDEIVVMISSRLDYQPGSKSG